MLQRGERFVHGACVTFAAPFFQITDLSRFFGRVDSLDGSVATRQRAFLGFGVAVDADHSQVAALDRLDTFDMRADEAFLHIVDGLGGAAARIQVGQRVTGQRLQLLGLGFDDMAAVEDVFIFQEVCFIGKDLLQAQRPLLVPGTWQAERLVPGRQLQRAAAGFLRQGDGHRLDQDAVDIVFRLRLGQAQRVHLNTIAEQQGLRAGHAIALAANFFPKFHKGTHLTEFCYETNSSVHEEGNATEDGFKV